MPEQDKQIRYTHEGATRLFESLTQRQSPDQRQSLQGFKNTLEDLDRRNPVPESQEDSYFRNLLNFSLSELKQLDVPPFLIEATLIKIMYPSPQEAGEYISQNLKSGKFENWTLDEVFLLALLFNAHKEEL